MSKLYEIKRYIRDHEELMMILSSVYRFFGMNHIKGKKGINLKIGGVFSHNLNVVNKGKENVLWIEKGCRMSNCQIRLFGDCNSVYIHHDCELKDVDIWISDGGNIEIGYNTHFTGKIHIACIEGKTVDIGEECLFSSDIVLRTGDSHIITDMNDNRLNHARDITIGRHTWVGNQVVILKGADIGADSIVGTRSLVTGKKFENNCVVAGSPARIVSKEVNWRPD